MPRSSTTADFKQDWKARLQLALQTKGISQRELARLCDLGSTSVYHSLQPDSDVKLSTIYLYADRLGVSPHWLVFGKEC